MGVERFSFHSELAQESTAPLFPGNLDRQVAVECGRVSPLVGVQQVVDQQARYRE
jgi:hypothetical protein